MDADEAKAHELHEELNKLGITNNVHWDRSPWGVRIPLAKSEDFRDGEEPSLFVLTEGTETYGSNKAEGWRWFGQLGNWPETTNDMGGTLMETGFEWIERNWMGHGTATVAAHLVPIVELLKGGVQAWLEDEESGDFLLDPDAERFRSLIEPFLEKGYDYEMWEMGRLPMIITDTEQDVRIGIADYTDDWWTVFVYYDHVKNDGQIFHDVTDLLGKVKVTSERATCRHCGRSIVNDPSEGWIDPEAGYDDEDGDGIWRTTCDSHDTFAAEHEPTLDDQEEIARRVLWYLGSEQYRKDVNILATIPPGH